MKLITDNPITVSEALDLLKKRQKESALSYEQQHALNYLEDLSRLSAKNANKLVKELKEAGLTDVQAVKVADLLPKKEEELKAAMAGSLKEDQLKKAMEIVKEYRKDASEPAKTKKVEIIEKPKEEKAETAEASSADGKTEETAEKTVETSQPATE